MLIGLVGIVIFGMTLPVTKVALGSFSPEFIAFGRGTLAGLAGLIYVILKKPELPNRKQVIQIFVIVLGIVIAFPYLMTLAMTHGSSAHGGIILGFMPILTTIIAALRFQEKPSWGFWFASILGTVIVLLYAFIQGSGTLSRLDSLLILAALFSAMGYAEGADLSKGMSPKLVISWAVIFALPLNVVISALAFKEQYLQASLPSMAALLFVGLMSMYVGFFFWYEGLAIGGIARVSQVQLIQPFVTLLGSSILLGESLTLLNCVFTTLVVASILLSKTMLVKRY